MTTLPDLEPAGLRAAIKDFQKTTGGFGADDDYTAIASAVRAYLSAARSTVPEAGKAVTDAMVKRATQEFLSHRGERPERIKRGGYALWEENAPAMRAAISAALASVPAPSGAEPVAWRWRLPSDPKWQFTDGPEKPRLGLPTSFEAAAIKEPVYATPQAVPAEEIAGLDEIAKITAALAKANIALVPVADGGGAWHYDISMPLTASEAEATSLRRKLEEAELSNKRLSDELDNLEQDACGADDDFRRMTERAETAEKALYLVTNERDNLSDNIAEITSREDTELQAMKARAESAERKLEEVRMALEPFGRIAVSENWSDGDMISARLAVGDIRRARSLSGASE